jgi:hypothetical protein
MGEIIKEFDQIKKKTSNHFLNLYTLEIILEEDSTNSLLTQIPRKISEEDNHKLNKQIEQKEILKSINQFNEDKALGPDGFTLHFYKKCWPIIKLDFIRMIRYVHNSN